jgi:DNA mismatch endonuclease, patch repair protein
MSWGYRPIRPNSSVSSLSHDAARCNRLREWARWWPAVVLATLRRRAQMQPEAMAEKISPETRSRMMSGIRGINTKPELMVRRWLHRAGFRFRLHAKDLYGRPDVVLPRWNTVIFVHGCFWHGHVGCRYFCLPKTRTEWWVSKIEANAARDVLAISRLRDIGWRVAVVWECALRTRPDEALAGLEAFLRSGGVFAEFAERPSR